METVTHIILHSHNLGGRERKRLRKRFLVCCGICVAARRRKQSFTVRLCVDLNEKLRRRERCLPSTSSTHTTTTESEIRVCARLREITW